jgi:hypothetical protein
MINFELKYLVIKLHDIARAIEREIGEGELSQEARQLADKLNAVATDNNRILGK